LPNIKSAKKRASLSAIFNSRNTVIKSEMRTSIRRFNDAVENSEADKVEAYKTAVSKIDVAVKKGVIHKNTAAHKKSAMTLKLNASEAK